LPTGRVLPIVATRGRSVGWVTLGYVALENRDGDDQDRDRVEDPEGPVAGVG
jgi:hypothetical protein